MYHVPALADEVARLASGCRRAVDGTVGAGGHAARLLESVESLLAIDRDPNAIEHARRRLADPRVEWHTGSFASPAALEAIRALKPDFVLLDLGVSFHQVDTDGRGFSFRRGVSLDMRMDPSGGRSAAELLNTMEEAELRETFGSYGDEPRARALATAVVRRRARTPFVVADDFVGAIRGVLGPRSGPSDFARLFQALRIAVNHELDDLAIALPAMRDSLVVDGTLAVITYHSGEDRIVKHAFREWARACVCPPRQPICTCRGRPLGRTAPKKPIRPSAEEIDRNPRCRSAKLRVFQRA